MLRSMFTAISSLTLHQDYLDVVANNLANANTIGFKANRMLFHDQFYQLVSPGSGPTENAGGTNPTQIGLGTQLGSISAVFTQGMLQSTGRSLDLAIQGNGFFVYDQGGAQRYSREGSLTLDSTGYLVNASTGLRAQGWQMTGGTIDTNQPATSLHIDTSRSIARATTSAVYGGNFNADLANGETINTTMGVYDSLGNLHSIQVTFTRAATQPDPNSTAWTWSVAGSNPAASGTIRFDQQGQFIQSTPPVTAAATIPTTTGSAPVQVSMDFTKLTMLSDATSAAITSQNGLPPGTYSEVYITPNDGEVYLVYSNGMREQVGQLAMARFTNPAGLIRSGHTMFTAGLNSGEPEIGVANSGGRGAIASGYLEGSNVDMAQEFTNMILAQRGFQASSRVISVSDELMQELVNLKR